MRHSLVAFIALLGLLRSAFGAVPANGAVAGEWTQDYPAALALAAESGLPVLLNFTGSDWCYWCKLMDRQVFSQQEWKDWAKGKIALAFIDFPSNQALVPEAYRRRNMSLQKKFEVRGYPTYIVLASDGKTILGQLGASRDASPASFIAQLEALLSSHAALQAPL